MNTKKVIFTLDIDAFFAQVEENKNPNFKNKPIAVGKKLNNKGIVATCNYKAREYGVHGGMPYFKAIKLCPELIFLDSNFTEYQEYSEEIFQICSKFTNKIQVASIDEAFLDVTNFLKNTTPLEYAKKIQNQIFEKTNLTTSIGISDNLELSKMASSMKKPFGIETLYKNEIKYKLWSLPIRKLYYVGRASEEIFIQNNIKTIGDLANINNNSLLYENIYKKIGVRLDFLFKISNGSGTTELDLKETNNKSLSYSKTLPITLNDYDSVKFVLSELLKEIIWRLKYRRMLTKTISFGTKDNSPFEKKSKSYSLKKPTDDIEIISEVIFDIFDNWWSEGKSVNFLSIGFENLVDKELVLEQLRLDDFKTDDKKEKQTLINQLNLEIGFEAFASGKDYKNIKKFKDKKLVNRNSVKFNQWVNKI